MTVTGPFSVNHNEQVFDSELQPQSNIMPVANALTYRGRGDSTALAITRAQAAAAALGLPLYIPPGFPGGPLLSGLSIGGAIAAGFVIVTGLTNDGGVTDNTAAFTAAAALLPASGGILIVPAGKYGVNWTPPANTTLWGQGQGSPTGPGATILCGLNSQSGNQVAPIQRTNAAVTLYNLTVDGGGAAGENYSCLYGLYDNAADTNHFDCYITGGTLASWFQDSGSQRPTGTCVRVSSKYGGTNNPNKVQRAVTGNGTTVGLGTTANSTTVTLDGVTNSFDTTLAANGQAKDVGRALVGFPNVLQGTAIIAVISATQATVNQQQATTQNFQAGNICQGEAAWLNGTDNQLDELRATNGTSRFQGGGGNQLTNAHITYTANSNAGPPSSTFEQGSWSIDNFYSDSSTPSSCNMCHLRGTKQILIAAPLFFQNSPNANPAIIENDTANSFTFSGGGFANHSGSGVNFSNVVTLARGNNTAFTWDGTPFAGPNSLTNSGGTPVIASGGTVGRVTMNYNGTLFGANVATYSNPANPANTVSATFVMAGLAIPFTPVASGKVTVKVTGAAFSSTAVANIQVGGRFGTGGAPANGAADTGTVVPQGNLNLRGNVSGSGGSAAFQVIGALSGLTPGTAYWFDLAFNTSNAADAANLASLQVEISEV